MSSSPVSVDVDPHVFLNGRPPLSEFLGFIKAQTVEGQAADDGALASIWRAANDHIQQLEATEAGIADGATIGDLPAELQPLRQRVLNDPIVQRSYALTPIEVGLVELDRLVVFQKQINLAHVARLRQRVQAANEAAALFTFCLPFEERQDPPAHYGPIGPSAWVFKSASNDFRVLNVQVRDAATVPGLDVGGVPTQVVIATLGYGSNYLSAIEIEGRLILSNGSHRAYALREAGHTHIPCLVQRATRRDELEVLLGPDHEVVQQPQRFLEASRPPLLKDYFDDALRMNVTAPRNVRQVQLGVNWNAGDLPG